MTLNPQKWFLTWASQLTPQMGMLFLQHGPTSSFASNSVHFDCHPLSFNSVSKFLGMIFDRSLSFGSHVHFLHTKFFPNFQGAPFHSRIRWGPSKESLSQLYKSYTSSFMTSPGWFPFLCDMLKKDLEVYLSSL